MAKGKTKKIEIDAVGETQEVSIILVEHFEGKEYSEVLKTDILTLLSPVFNKLAEWKEKVDSIEIKSIEDTASMKLAEESRKYVKTVRLDVKKQVEAKIAEIKEQMNPYLLEIDAWKNLFSFAESTMKGIESAANEKEKHIEILRKKTEDDLREVRAKETEHLRAFIPPLVDIAKVAEEDWRVIIRNAELAKKADDQEKAEAKELENKRENELKLIKRREHRVHDIYALGMKRVDGEEVTFTYEDLIITDKSVTELEDEDFNSVFSALKVKIADLREKADLAEKVRKEKEAEAVNQRRKIITDRIAMLLCVTIKSDGLYWDVPEYDIYKKILDYDTIYEYSQENWEAHVIELNTFINKEVADKAEEKRLAKEKQDKIDRDLREKEKQDAIDKALKDKADQELRDKEREAEAQASSSDREKMKHFADRINDIRLDMKDETFKSESHKKLSVNAQALLVKVVDFIDERNKK